MIKRSISVLLALILVISMPATAFAAEYDLAIGSVTISASDAGQTVSQNSITAPDSAPVITQSNSGTATSNTITVTTSGDATANFTIRDVNIAAGNSSAIDVGDSSAAINVEGSNTVTSGNGNAPVHVSDGDLTITSGTGGSLEAVADEDSHAASIGSNVNEAMSGSIHITGNVDVTAGGIDGWGQGTAIGSGDDGAMKGSITIDGEASVWAESQEDGAGIGAGDGGAMSGSITIGDKAKVTAISDDDGAGIGGGDGPGDMSGTITITGDANVTAWSGDDGAGIGAGDSSGDMSGSIYIGGNAKVTAGSDDDGAGIGAGDSSKVTSSGKIVIGDNATVTAIGEDEGAGIGSGDGETMDGAIIIRDNAQVTAIGGDEAAAIGSDGGKYMNGTIAILGNAQVTTGNLYNDAVWFKSETGKIEYTVDKNKVGIIGSGTSVDHGVNTGSYIIGPDTIVNGVTGGDMTELLKFVNAYVQNDEAQNLSILDTGVEDGEFFAQVEGGQGTVDKILYDGSETKPTAPGSYTVECVMIINDEEIKIQIGVLTIPEPEAPAASAASGEEEQDIPLYRVVDEAGKDLPYEANVKDGLLTITADYDYAALTGQLWGIRVLMAQGIEEICFTTQGAASEFDLDDLLKEGQDQDSYRLTHDGSQVTFQLGEDKTGIAQLLD